MMFNLLCYVRGDDSQHAFTVKIEEDEVVDSLKKAIKARKTPFFDHIPADSLVLWNVSVPFSRNLREAVEACNLVDNDALQPPDILSDVFLFGLEKRTVHIIVDQHPGELFIDLHLLRPICTVVHPDAS
jgi:Crinkler effector protein N-terminal domain